MFVKRIYFGNKTASTGTLAPNLVTDADTFFQPAVAHGDVTLTPSLYSDTDTFFVPTTSTSNDMHNSLFTDTDTFYAPTAAGGAVTLTPSLYSDADTFYVPVASAGAVTLAPNLYSDADTFGQPTVSSAATLLPGLYDDADTFGQPTVSVGGITLTASVYSDADTFFQPIVSVGGITITPSLYDDADTFFQPAISGDAAVAPSLVTDTDSLYQPTVSVATIALSPAAFTDADLFYTPVLAVAPALVVDADDVPSPSVSGQFVVLPPFVQAEVIIYVPVDASIYLVFPPLFVDTDAFFHPNFSTSSVSMLPTRYVDTDVFYVPTVQAQTTQGGGGGGSGVIPKNVKYAMSFTMNASGLIVALQIQSSQAKSADTRMMLYADNAGTPGALVAQSAVKTSLTVGVNNYPLTVPYSVLAGGKIWAAFHTNANVNVLGNSTAGSRYNTDLFSDGASNPFGASSVDNKKAPILLVVLSSVNATIAPTLYNDADTIYSPSIDNFATASPTYVVDTDFFYSATVLGGVVVQPPLLSDADTFGAPAVTPGPVTISPPYVTTDDAIILSVIGVGDVNVKFPAPLLADDVFYDAAVTVMGGEELPGIVVDDDLFYVPDVLGVFTLAPQDVVDTDAVRQPTVTPGPVVVLPPRVMDIDQYPFADLLSTGVHALLPGLFGSDDAIYPPARAGAGRRAHHVALTGAGAQNPALTATADNGRTVSALSLPQPALEGTAGGVLLEGDATGHDIELEGNDA